VQADAKTTPETAHGYGEETRLVSEARTGSERAFEQLYRTHVARVYGLCLRLAGNAVQAEELTQDTFVRAWERLHSFRGESAFATWLCRVAVNIVFSRHRAGRRRTARRATLAEHLRLGNPLRRGGGGGRLGARLDLEYAISRLPEGARTVFVLHEIEGYRHEEIAELSGMAPGTSKAQLHRARRLLREALNE
jgi:RNA polymerase sigma-70 factor (ECF subfamily)